MFGAVCVTSIPSLAPPPAKVPMQMTRNHKPRTDDKDIFTILCHFLYFHIKKTPTGKKNISSNMIAPDF
jgi:hypothetical protein